MTEFIDIHCHYEDERFAPDRDEVISSLPQKGVKAVIDASCSVKDSIFVKNLAEKYPHLYFCVGIHPENADEYSFDTERFLEEIYSHPKCVGVGETGLDFHWSENPAKEIQCEAFARQIFLSKKHSLPIVIHCREAVGLMTEMLKSEDVTCGVMHCFSESKEVASFCLDRGLYFSFGGTCTFKNARRAVENLEYIPRDRILLETDSPYLAPEPVRGTRNDSSNIHHIIYRIAEIWQTTPEEVCAITVKNTEKLFFDKK